MKLHRLQIFLERSRRASSGFTLIEMMVVIAVIGILSAAVLAGLGPLRAKARDARIISGVQQIRSLAEIFYQPADASPYSVLNDIAANPDLKKISDDITSQGGSLQVKADGFAYAAYSKLASNPLQAYCVDSTGSAKTVATPSVAVVVCP